MVGLPKPQVNRTEFSLFGEISRTSTE